MQAMNWSEGIKFLLSSNTQTVRSISDYTGLSVSSVYDLKNGNSIEPRGIAAVRLHRLLVAAGYAAAIKEAA